MFKQFLTITLFLIALAAAFVVLTKGTSSLKTSSVISTSTLNSTTQTEKDWPAFTMVFKEEDGNFSMIKDGSIGTQVYEFVYKDPKDWKITITESPSIDIQGSWRSYNGTTITTYFARTEGPVVEDATELKGIFVPNEWLNPLYYANLTKKPNVEKLNDAPSGYEIWRMTEEIPCQPVSPVETPGQVKQDNCDPAKPNKTVTSDFTYRSDYHIPVKVNYSTEGRGVYTATVEKLEINQ